MSKAYRHKKPTCRRGHEFTVHNTVWKQQPNSGKRYRECQECKRWRVFISAEGLHGEALSRRIDDLAAGGRPVPVRHEPFTWVP